MRRTLSPCGLFSVLLLAAVAQPVTAQCTNVWLPGDGLPGTNGPTKESAVWDPDGPGPASPRVVLAGSFTIAGTESVEKIVSWDPATGEWSSLGVVTDGTISALAGAPNGDLLIGGWFTTVNGAPANRIARFDGTTWSALGSGLDSVVFSLTVLPNGDVIAGGFFMNAGGAPAERIARWDGSAWSPIGSGLPGSVQALIQMPNGDLVAGCDLAQSGTSLMCIARWDGVSWQPLSPNTPDVNALALAPNGDLIAGGDFVYAGGVPARYVARWDGAAWHPLGAGCGDATSATAVFALAVLQNGDVVAGGTFGTAGGLPAQRIARWDGASWSTMGGGAIGASEVALPRVDTLTTLPNGDLIAAGAFGAVGSVGANNVARWDGASWSALQAGFSDGVYALHTLPDGTLLAGGNFRMGQDGGHHVARWDGAAWSAVGNGTTDDGVLAFLTRPAGHFVAGGSFSLAGGVSVHSIAEWDGVAWCRSVPA